MKPLAALVVLLVALPAQAQNSGTEKSTADIARATLPAVVTIRSRGPDGISTGSGFIIHRSGTIVTNLHVIEGATSVEVKISNGDVFDQVRVRAFDRRRDLAIIQIPGFSLPTLRSGNSDKVQIGDRVVLIGSPKGLEGSVSSGLVSAVRVLDGTRLFQTDAAANPGNSGGPMFNSKGEVIGILTFKLPDSEGLNFVVPVNYARGLWDAKEALTLEQFSARLGNVASTPATAQATGRPPLTGPPPLVNVAGEWNATLTSNNSGTYQAVLTLRQDGAEVTGNYRSSLGGTGTISGTVSAFSLSFSITSTTPNCGGTLAGQMHFNAPGSSEDGRGYLNYAGSTTCGGSETGKGPLVRR
jgi:S1-C subfamily serine protease